MNKLLVTGIAGFVGGHVLDILSREDEPIEIHGICRSIPTWDYLCNPDARSYLCLHRADLREKERIQEIINDVSPDAILHLAAQSSVTESWRDPVGTFSNNTEIFLNVLEAVRKQGGDCKIVLVGSAEAYGIAHGDILQLQEDAPLVPANPYAMARISQEHIAHVYSKGYGLSICSTRSFSHFGAGQPDKFVISGIAKQFAQISLGIQKPVVIIGNGSVVRDFLDVRDVVSAYRAILEHAPSGSIYNVCSGTGHSIYDIVTLYTRLLKIPVQIHEDLSLYRPTENPVLVGDNTKIRRELRWSQIVPIETSFIMMYEYWYRKLSK